MFRFTNEIKKSIVNASEKTTALNNIEAIKLIQQINNGYTPSKEDINTLSKYNGWGAAYNAFSLEPKGWQVEAQQQLIELLGNQYNPTRETILNAHYTDFNLMSAMWTIVEKLGFNGGNILEPSCGAGWFFGSMPENIAKKSNLYGVEVDVIAASVASLLYPEAQIHDKKFENFDCPNDSFDLIIGNVPFGAYSVADVKYDYLNLTIHNYFLCKSADLLRAGGLMVVITSDGTLSSLENKHRLYLSQRLKLIEAIKLPSGICKDVCATEVAPDLLIFQKINDGNTELMGEEYIESGLNGREWLESRLVDFRAFDWYETKDGEKRENLYREFYLNKCFVSEYHGRLRDFFIKNNKSSYSTPYQGIHRILGVPMPNKLYGNGVFIGSDNRDAIADLLKIPFEAVYTDIGSKDVECLPSSLEDVKEYEFCEYKGNVYQRVGYSLKQVDFADKVKDFWKVRRVLLQVIDAQSSPKKLEAYQQALEIVYNHFVNRWSHINDKKNISQLGSDPNYYLVRSLENKDGTLSDIFNKRVSRQASKTSVVKTPIQAIHHSLNYKGYFDIDYCCKILGNAPKEKVVSYLSDKNKIFYDPSLNEWVLSEDYLSGNVVRKKYVAIEHGLQKNIEALDRVIPLPRLPKTDNIDLRIECIKQLGIDWDALSEEQQQQINSKNINIKLGANWIPSEIIARFAADVLGIRVKVKYLGNHSASWCVSGDSADSYQYGTIYLDSAKILEKTLNSQSPRVNVYDDDRQIDKAASMEETEKARNAARLQKQAFIDWIWNDRDRALSLSYIYNTEVNVFVEPKIDGSYLELPGSNPEIALTWWQKRAVAKIIRNQSTFLAHCVGAGKTYAMIAGIMECRRLGLSQKPILIVLKSTINQIHESWLNLYPLANVLVPNKFDAESRKLFTSAIATNDYDGIILSHEQFFSLALSTKYQLAFLNQEKDILEEYLIENKSNRAAVKQINRARKNLEARIGKVLDASEKRKDDHIAFEGICDMIVIDEIHKMKNLQVQTKLYNVKGVSNVYSQRATDTYLKLLYASGNLLSSSNNKPGKIVGSTGTVLSNTMAEMFTWQRMFQLPLLEKLGISHFDAWQSQFAIETMSAEVNSVGAYKVFCRLKEFVNLPVLRSLLGQFMDIVTANDVDLNTPEAQFVDIVCQPSEAQLLFLRNCLHRASNIEARLVEPSQDNFLKITNDMTLASLSMLLLGVEDDAKETKLNHCINNAYQVYKISEEIKGVQLIFCDHGTPRKDQYNVYDHIKAGLIQLGVNESEIALIHDYPNAKKIKLFELVNSGQVRIVVGSTEKLGTGCNLQDQGIITIHHLDAPWRPSDLVQREGRSVRQGNGKNIGGLAQTWIFRYITERLDALRWQNLKVKQDMFNQFMAGHDIDCMQSQDIGETGYSYAQVNAIASGSPLLIEETNLNNELNGLLIQERSFRENQLSINSKIDMWASRLKTMLQKLDALEVDLPVLSKLDFDGKECEKLHDKIFHLICEIKDGKQKVVKSIPLLEGINLILRGTNTSMYVGNRIKVDFGVEATVSGEGFYEFPFRPNDKSCLNFSDIHPMDSIKRLVKLLPDYRNNLEEKIKVAKVEQDRASSVKGQAFPFAQRLTEVQERLSIIRAELDSSESLLGEAEEITIDLDSSSVIEITEYPTIPAFNNYEWIQTISEFLQSRTKS